jgi:hypothetical protein
MHKDPAEIEAASARALEEFDRREEQVILPFNRSSQEYFLLF